MDKRTKRQKLQAMANQSVSPNEAEIAKVKLKDLKEEGTTTIHNGDTLTFTFEMNFTQPSVEDVFVYDFTHERWHKVS